MCNVCDAKARDRANIKLSKSDRRIMLMVYIYMIWIAVCLFFPYRPLVMGLAAFGLLTLAAMFVSGFLKGAYGGRAASEALRTLVGGAGAAWGKVRAAMGRVS